MTSKNAQKAFDRCKRFIALPRLGFKGAPTPFRSRTDSSDLIQRACGIKPAPVAPKNVHYNSTPTLIEVIKTYEKKKFLTR